MLELFVTPKKISRLFAVVSGFEAHVELRQGALGVEEHLLPRMLSPFLRTFEEWLRLPHSRSSESHKAGDLINLRGRPQETFPSGGGTKEFRSQDEELLSISGEIFDVNGETEMNDKNSPPSAPFVYQIRTSFLEFRGAKQIRYAKKNLLSGPIQLVSDEIQFAALPMLAPCSITGARVGVECFRPEFFGSVFGFAPKIESRFYLEVNEEKITLFISGSKFKDFEARMLLDALDNALERSGLYRGLFAHVSTELGG